MNRRYERSPEAETRLWNRLVTRYPTIAQLDPTEIHTIMGVIGGPITVCTYNYGADGDPILNDRGHPILTNIEYQ